MNDLTKMKWEKRAKNVKTYIEPIAGILLSTAGLLLSIMALLVMVSQCNISNKQNEITQSFNKSQLALQNDQKDITKNFNDSGSISEKTRFNSKSAITNK